jgi:RNA ligase (TIGR02306 family)
LELATVKGWQLVVPKDRYAMGDRIVFIPPDSLVPLEVSDALGVTNYLSNGRVRCVTLRGEPSFGVPGDMSILPPGEWKVGDDVADVLGITKYLPPFRATEGDADTPSAFLQTYTDIQNLRDHPDVFEPGERVVATEKIHGTNCKCALIDGEEMAGSMDVRRKRPEDDVMARHLYWMPFTIPGVPALLRALADIYDAKQVILYGEVFGSKVQKPLHYGCVGQLGFRAFDILVDGMYLDYEVFVGFCDAYDVPRVPELYVGPFDIAAIKAVSDGPTTLGGDHIREGVVVKPLVERTHPKVGRLIAKYVGDAYLLKKAGGKISDTTDQ